MSTGHILRSCNCWVRCWGHAEFLVNTTKEFSKVVVLTYHHHPPPRPLAMRVRSQAPHCRSLVLSYFFIWARLTAGLWHLIVVLIHIFWGLGKLITFSNVYLPLWYSCLWSACSYLLLIFLSCWIVCLFLIGFRSYLYVLHKSSLSDTYITDISFHSVACIFILWIAASGEQKFLISM